MARVFTKALGSTHELRLNLTQDGQSIPNNRSTVGYHLYIERVATNAGRYHSKNTSRVTLTINGTKVLNNSAFTYDFRNTNRKNLAQGTINVTHGSNGAKTVSASASISAADLLPSGSGSGTFKLSTIPRASTISTFANFTMGDDIPWKVDRKHSSFTHRVRLFVNDVVIAREDDQGASGTLSIGSIRKENMLNQLSNTSRTRTAKLEVVTYNSSGTQIGSTQTKTATATAREDDVRPTPTISSIVEAGNGLSGVFVQNKSKLRVRSSGSGLYGATIKAYRVTVDGKNYNSSDITTGVIDKKGTVKVTLRVTDTRNVTQTISQDVTFIEYYSPKITKFTATRYPDQESSDLRVEYSYDIAPVSNKNDKQVIVRYRRVGQTNNEVINNTSDYNQIDEISTTTGVLNSDYSYEVDIILRDSYNTADDIITTAAIGTGFELMNWHSSGKGMAVGKVAEKSDAFEFGMKAYDKNENEIIGLGGEVNDDVLTNTNVKLGENTLLLEALTSLGIDFPIEWGDNYTKWNSGRLEKWSTANVNLNSDGATTVSYPSGGGAFVGEVWGSHSWSTNGASGSNWQNRVRAKKDVIVAAESYRWVIRKDSTSFNTNHTDKIMLRAVGRWK